MSRRVYSREEKVNILARLQSNGGNIILTAAQEGVPERTLYTWRRRFYAENQRRQSPPPSPPITLNDFADDMQVMRFLRRKIMAELLSVASTFDGVNAISPAQRMTLLAQLMDQLMKLDTHLKPYVPQEPTRYIFGWYAGLYIRSGDDYRGPFAPSELPPRWETRYGEDTRLEIFWGDDTFTIAPPALLDEVRKFEDEPAELVDDDLDDEGWEIGYGDNKWGGMPGIDGMGWFERTAVPKDQHAN